MPGGLRKARHGLGFGAGQQLGGLGGGGSPPEGPTPFLHGFRFIHPGDQDGELQPGLAQRRAGRDDIRDGIRHNAAGEPLRLEFMTTAGNRIRELSEIDLIPTAGNVSTKSTE